MPLECVGNSQSGLSTLLPLGGGLSLMTSLLRAWVGLPTLSTPSNDAVNFLGCPDLLEWGVVQAWWAGRVARGQSFQVEADVWGIVASLFVTSCGCESLCCLSNHVPRVFSKMFPLIDPALAWARVLKCMGRLLGLSAL